MNEIEIYEAISYMKEMRSICDTDSGVVPQSYDMALSALREKAECEKGCEYCNGRFGIAAHHINDAGLQAGTNKIAKFCPMCGKALKEVNRD